MTAIQETVPPTLPRIRRISLRALLALGLLIATNALVVVDIAVWGGQRFAPPPVSFIKGQAIFVAEMFYSVSYAAMGWLLATRLPRNPLGWLFQFLGVGMAAQMAATFLVQQAHQALRPLDYPLVLAAWAGSSLHLPTIIVINAVIFAIFPHGQVLSRRWGLGIWAAAIGGLLTIVAVGTLREGLLWYPTLYNPFAAPASIEPFMGVVAAVGLALVVVGVGVCATSVFVRYRRADHDEKAQVRWIALAVLLMAGAGVPFILARYGLRTDYATGELLLATALVAGCFLPVAAAIAIMRYGLYNIDVIINRALVYIPLTAILAGTYAATVALVQRTFIALTGDRSDAAVVITTLVLVGMFTPVKDRLQKSVDHRFKPVRIEPIPEGSTLDMLRDRIEVLEAKVSKLPD